MKKIKSIILYILSILLTVYGFSIFLFSTVLRFQSNQIETVTINTIIQSIIGVFISIALFLISFIMYKRAKTIFNTKNDN